MLMKHIVITGASRGLGRAIAMGFAVDGWSVSGCGTDTAALRSLSDELGPEHLTHACDVTDVAAVTERFGGHRRADPQTGNLAVCRI